MKIVILDSYVANPGDLSWDGLGRLGELTLYDRTPAGKTLERMKGAQAVLTNKTVINREIIEKSPELRYIGVLATGFNIVDTAAAAEHGVTVCNVPAYSTESVAQHVFALLLECCSHVGEYSASVRAGDWARCADFSYSLSPITELSGKTLGVVGFGAIGSRVAEIGAAFGMKVLGYSRHFDLSRETERIKYAPLERLLAESDVVTLHCPATPETTGLINESTLEKMKKGAILINTARGALIEEEAVAKALRSGRLSFAAMDVMAREPVAPDDPLVPLENCIVTPHVAWAPREARVRLLDITVSNLSAFIAGKPQNKVN